MKLTIFWFRRDLRLIDNTALFECFYNSESVVMPIFILDTNIVESLPESDARISFIYKQLEKINQSFSRYNAQLNIYKGDPLTIFKQLIETHNISAVYTNKDYEPYAKQRDLEVSKCLEDCHIPFKTFKDQVIFEYDEILKPNQEPYTVYTPYSKKWISKLDASPNALKECSIKEEVFNQKIYKEQQCRFPSLESLGFKHSNIIVPEYTIAPQLYSEQRNIPSVKGTSFLSTHLRFGTISIRHVINQLNIEKDIVFLKELIWRAFFMQIIAHFPHVVNNAFKQKYDNIRFSNNETHFKQWCEGKTGYPIVDAGMRELVATGLMHNRVRMVTASFLCKHLLIDWRWGEAFFAKHLLDFDLAQNNGNWQWVFGSGCDASPYFRIFNPYLQQQKFDPNLIYIKQWIPELDSLAYPPPIVNHESARKRTLEAFKAVM